MKWGLQQKRGCVRNREEKSASVVDVLGTSFETVVLRCAALAVIKRAIAEGTVKRWETAEGRHRRRRKLPQEISNATSATNPDRCAKRV